jgi:hypothetical protein
MSAKEIRSQKYVNNMLDLEVLGANFLIYFVLNIAGLWPF